MRRVDAVFHVTGEVNVSYGCCRDLFLTSAERVTRANEHFISLSLLSSDQVGVLCGHRWRRADGPRGRDRVLGGACPPQEFL